MQKYHVVSYRIRTFRTDTTRYDMILLHSLKSLLSYLVNKRLQLCIAKLLAVLFTRLFRVWIVPDVGSNKSHYCPAFKRRIIQAMLPIIALYHLYV